MAGQPFRNVWPQCHVTQCQPNYTNSSLRCEREMSSTVCTYNNLKSIHKKLVSIFYHLSFSLFCTVYICVCMQTKSGHFGSIQTEVETRNKLGMTKCPVRLVPKNSKEYKELKPVVDWYNKEKKNRKFKHILAVAYQNWKELDYINNKVVKKKATSLGAPPAGPQVQQ